MCVCVCVCVGVGVGVSAWVHACGGRGCVRVCVHACVRACACVREWVWGGGVMGLWVPSCVYT